MFTRIAARSKLPQAGLWASVGKAAISFNQGLTALAKKERATRVDVLWDEQSRRLGFCFLRGKLKGSFSLIQGKDGSLTSSVSAGRVVRETGLRSGFYKVERLPEKETPEDYTGQTIFFIAVDGAR